jgi:hypothetical protein
MSVLALEATFRTALSLAVLVGALGCGADKECRDLQPQMVDEARMCLAAPTPAGVRACLNPDELRGKGLFSVCLADEEGRIYVAWVSSSEWIEGAGWSHSEIPHAPGTLSVDAQRRCDQSPVPEPAPERTCVP